MFAGTTVSVLAGLVAPFLLWRTANKVSNASLEKARVDSLYSALEQAKKELEETHGKLMACMEVQLETKSQLGDMTRRLAETQGQLLARDSRIGSLEQRVALLEAQLLTKLT
jgi:septal ring factor EnvC (AmiA/AmiB activator)